MRWYACPDADRLSLTVAPQLASWNRANDPEQLRRRPFLDAVQGLLSAAQTQARRALRLDVGRPTGRNLLAGADLDNYIFPPADRLQDSEIVSVWCTKHRGEESFLRIKPAREVSPAEPVWVADPTVSYSKTALYKAEIQLALAAAAELPAGPVRLEIAFLVGPHRKWWHLWKPTIDGLTPLLGHDPEGGPRDDRITVLGMHLTVDENLLHDVHIAVVDGSNVVGVELNQLAEAQAGQQCGEDDG